MLVGRGDWGEEGEEGGVGNARCCVEEERGERNEVGPQPNDCPPVYLESSILVRGGKKKKERRDGGGGGGEGGAVGESCDLGHQQQDVQ